MRILSLDKDLKLTGDKVSKFHIKSFTNYCTVDLLLSNSLIIHQISLIYFKLLKNTKVLIETFHKLYKTFASVLYQTYNLSSSAQVCISDTTQLLMGLSVTYKISYF
jgi:hypothetical protein